MNRRFMKIILAVLMVAVFGTIGYFVIMNKSKPIAPQTSTDGISSSDLSKFDNQSTTSTAEQESTKTSIKQVSSFQCSGMTISLPEKWVKLEVAKKSNLDTEGCYRDNMGCLCAKKDPVDPTQNVMFSVLVSSPPTRFTLNDSLPKDAFDVKNINFLGLPAVKFTTSGTKKLGGINFFKGQKIYSFTLSAKSDTFNELWPDMMTALENTKF